MEVIKGRDLAGAQLTTNGTGEDDQDPRLHSEGTSDVQGGGGLPICSAVCQSVGTGLAGLSPCLSISLFGSINFVFALEYFLLFSCCRT